MPRALHIRKLGLVEYEDGLAMQKALAAARGAGLVTDTLLLLEHPRVITLGRGAKAANVLWNAQQLDARGFSLVETDRGGDVTYHGPGQLVGYPILDLKPDRRDVRRYVNSVEELMIRTARDFGVIAERVPGRPGIWVNRAEASSAEPSTPRAQSGVRDAWEKLGAIGVHLSRWITTHGFAFNVTTDLADFRAIVPCGIQDAGVCSLQSLRASPLQARSGAITQEPLARERDALAISFADVEERAALHGAEVWESEPFEIPVELEAISLTIVREGLHGDELLLLHRVPARGGFWQTLTGKRERGEAALAAAARELFEETGFAPALEELRELDYVHAFALDPSLAPDAARVPIFCRETAFAVRVHPSAEPRLDPREHDAHRWVSLEDALPLLPFAGLRRAARLALQQLA